METLFFFVKQGSLMTSVTWYYRWVCTSADPQDLDATDEIATEVLQKAIDAGGKTLVTDTTVSILESAPQIKRKIIAMILTSECIDYLLSEGTYTVWHKQ